MEYLHAALMLKALDKEITEKAITHIFLTGVGLDIDEIDYPRIKALVDSIDNVDFEKVFAGEMPPKKDDDEPPVAPSIMVTTDDDDDDDEPETETAPGMELLFG